MVEDVGRDDLEGEQAKLLGAGIRIHVALLETLRTKWVSLLALPGDQRPEQRLHRQLGYRYAGPYQARTDGPVLDLLLLRTGAGI
ncbi:hypothetical protein F4556_007559 [Kitasatospora gansuensis]|uniref:N-acetyltransferase domain-containing protein n=1 Tax=Kitasatospora gansuensis TaxID=258050 RepID=A0A7W7SK69_9ACTN|nr:hypothetical protein [Kitasatospora gansuensis]MBB4951905.1 hypothetical protein [Kitasatospora gansuensis]